MGFDSTVVVAVGTVGVVVVVAVVVGIDYYYCM